MMVACVIGTKSSSRILRNQLVLATVYATHLYSTSTLEREMVGWRFDEHETKFSPRKTQKS